MNRLLAAVAAVVAIAAPALGQDVAVDPKLPKYKPVEGITGTVRSMGSDTMNNLMTLWGEEMRRFYPSIKPEVEGKGSSTAPPALIEGQAQFGAMSRAMKATEIDKFEEEFGYKPTPLRVAVDCIGIFVHKDCPLDEISLEQVRRVFSVEGPDMTWGDLGVTDASWVNQRVSVFGRNSSSGTYGFFKQIALGNADFKPTVKEQPGSSSVVQGIAEDRFAMGYSGIGYKTAGVKALNLSDQWDAYPPEPEFAYSGEYPLARFLYIYVNYDRREGLDPLRREFIKMVFSQRGQEAVVKDGYYPVGAAIARDDLMAVGIRPSF